MCDHKSCGNYTKVYCINHHILLCYNCQMDHMHYACKTINLDYVSYTQACLGKVKQAIDHIQGAMSDIVYGSNKLQYKSQLNEIVAEYGELQTEFDDLILAKKTYSILGDLKLKVENLLRMVRDHPMYATLKDLVFDLYCKNPRKLDPKIAAAPNLTFLYEFGIMSDPPAKL